MALEGAYFVDSKLSRSTNLYPLTTNDMKLYAVVVGMLVAVSASGQGLNPNWKQDLKTNLEKFMQCSSTGDKAACAGYVGESLKVVYKVDDFYNRKAARHMSSAEIADYLKNATSWSMLGQSYDQQVLDQAGKLANDHKAVVAVYNNGSGIGHIVLITPGEMTASGSWGLKVPPAASYFATEPAKSFTDKGLSFAFSKQMLKDVTIYARKY